METLPMKITIVGDIFCDIIAYGIVNLPQWGQDAKASGISIYPGGSGLNTTVQAANYATYIQNNTILRIFSAVGKDFQGDLCLSKLKHPQIISHVKENINERTGSCIVLSGPNDRSFVTDEGCMGIFTWESYGLDTILDTNHLHVTGYYNCAKLKHSVKDLFLEARNKGISTSLTTQYDSSNEWNGVQELAPYLNILLCNECELLAISACETHHSAAWRLLCWGCGLVVATLGEHGVKAYYREGGSGRMKMLHQSVGKVAVVDPTGAGDAFAGAFLVEYLRRSDLQAALRAGCATAACSLQRVSGSSMLDTELLKQTAELYLDCVEQEVPSEALAAADSDSAANTAAL